MRVSRFDVVASALAALLWFLGMVVAVLVILWCLMAVTESPVRPTPPEWKFRGATAAGGEAEFEQPEGPEVEQLVETDLAEVIAEIEIASSRLAGHPTVGTNGKNASGFVNGPDSRPPGDPDGHDIVPRHQRWHLVFEATSQTEYAKQLDDLEIELGAFGGGISGIDLASNLASEPAARHVDDPQKEKRLYFSWSRATALMRYEHNLLSAAGIRQPGARIVVKFIPRALENRLAYLELEHARQKGRSEVGQIAKTVFETKPVRDGYAFVVHSQRYRDK